MTGETERWPSIDIHLCRRMIESLDRESIEAEAGLASRAFLATDPSKDDMVHWLHEMRDYLVRYAWSPGMFITAIGLIIGHGRLMEPPSEGDDFGAWRARWGSR